MIKEGKVASLPPKLKMRANGDAGLTTMLFNDNALVNAWKKAKEMFIKADFGGDLAEMKEFFQMALEEEQVMQLAPKPLSWEVACSRVAAVSVFFGNLPKRIAVLDAAAAELIALKCLAGKDCYVVGINPNWGAGLAEKVIAEELGLKMEFGDVAKLLEKRKGEFGLVVSHNFLGKKIIDSAAIKAIVLSAKDAASCQFHITPGLDALGEKLLNSRGLCGVKLGKTEPIHPIFYLETVQ